MSAEALQCLLVGLSVGVVIGMLFGYLVGRLDKHQAAALLLAAAVTVPAFSQEGESNV